MITWVGMRYSSRALVALLWIGLLTSQATSQTATSTLRINVVDVAGRAVSGASVILKREGHTDEITQVTTADGAVTFVNLPPGSRKVTVKANGFATLEQSVTVNENQSSDLTLSVGPPIRAKLDSLRPGWSRRFGRLLQYQFELNEQPGTVLLDFLVPTETGTPETVTLPQPNPLRYLQKHSLSFKLGELIPERLALFKRGSDYLKNHPEADADKELSKILCGDKHLITCLTLGGSWWQRAAMGTSFTASVGQRTAVINQILILSAPLDKRNQFTGGFVFDPAKLFPSASNWKGTLDDVQKIDKSLALIGASDLHEQPWKNLWAIFIPKVEFKMIAQFDFLKYEGVLRQAPFPEHALNTWTFTWDLTRVIPDTKQRIDADAIEEALYDLRSTLGREKPEKWEKRCKLFLGQEVREVEELHPTFRGDSCKRLAEVISAEKYQPAVVKYQLSCVLKDKKGVEKDRKIGAECPLSNTPADCDLKGIPAKPNPNPCNW